MRKTDIKTLVDFNHWANRRVLRAAERLGPGEWAAASTHTTRSLRATLVHALDTEWSWRVRLQDPSGPWQEEIAEDMFASVADLRAAWGEEEQEMLGWVESLSEEDLSHSTTPIPGAEAPLWHYIFHLLSHSTQQRTEAAVLLTMAGHSPGEFEFLNYMLRERRA